MEIIGYFSTIFVGISLGLIGGGGSILILPILYYLFQVPIVMGTAYSLFIVGVASAFGAYRHSKQNNVVFKTGVIFGLPALISVFLVRYQVMPLLPETMSLGSDFVINKDTLIMTAFSAVMLAASLSMIRKKKIIASEPGINPSLKSGILFVIIEGIFIGAITGFVGAGGGFLIIPALVVIVGLPMKQAIGTSLFIITLKSMVGFGGDLLSGAVVDWLFLGSLTLLSILGVFLGEKLGKQIPGSSLKPAFGWFTLLAGAGILAQQIF